MQYPNTMSPTSYGFPQHQSSPSYGRSQQAVVNLPPPSPFGSPTNKTMSGHPLLTPSGRAFAVGGKVQNISSDPLSPCIMYWPDNEPFPEQGQIRPSGLMGVPVSIVFLQLIFPLFVSSDSFLTSTVFLFPAATNPQHW
jgi:hypothetical protein